MSRIGNKPIEIPGNVQVSMKDNLLKAKGPKGELDLQIPEEIEIKLEKNVMSFSRKNEQKKVKSLHGLIRSLAANVIEGVTNGFKKNLQIIGVGYKAELKGKNLFLALGFSHTILFVAPEGIEFEVPKPTIIIVSGIEKQLVGEVAARIRRLRPPEPYKGKGIRYADEHVRRKAGKTAA